jgi:hypothetical protein
MYFEAVAKLMGPNSKFIIADFFFYAWIPRFESQLERWFKIEKKEDITENVLESLRVDSTTENLLSTTFPFPLSSIMKHLWALEGTPLNTLIKKGWLKYNIYTLSIK